MLTALGFPKVEGNHQRRFNCVIPAAVVRNGVSSGCALLGNSLLSFEMLVMEEWTLSEGCHAPRWSTCRWTSVDGRNVGMYIRKFKIGFMIKP